MIRSQIYLTEDERNSLKLISEETGRTQSDLIREAIDSIIIKINKKNSHKKKKKLLDSGKIEVIIQRQKNSEKNLIALIKDYHCGETIIRY